MAHLPSVPLASVCPRCFVSWNTAGRADQEAMENAVGQALSEGITGQMESMEGRALRQLLSKWDVGMEGWTVGGVNPLSASYP